MASDSLDQHLNHTNGSHPGSFEAICRNLLLEKYAPASVLIDHDQQILHSSGPIEHYLNLPSGQPCDDLLTVTPVQLRARLMAAIERVTRDHLPLTIAGGSIPRAGDSLPYFIDIHPVPHLPEPAQLVCFVIRPKPENGNASLLMAPKTAILERQLQSFSAELEGALRNLQGSNEEHRVFNEEAVAASEKYFAGIAELTSRKARLESLSQEMMALNMQLRNAFTVHQNDALTLRNILTSMGVAVLRLGPKLTIEFFTPQIEPFFRLIAADIGRPLADLKYLADDPLLAGDCNEVLVTEQPLDREILLQDSRQALRQIAPYRKQDGEVDGLVVTFVELATAGASSSASAADQLEDAARRIAPLTEREREVMKLVVAGRPSRFIAGELGISQRTVENHRAAIMRKTRTKSLPALARLAFASGLSKITDQPFENA